MRYPVGDNPNELDSRWYIAQGHGVPQSYGYHDGWDLNLRTGGDSDLGQPIYAVSDWVKRYYHFNSHPNSGFGIHYVYEINTPLGLRWIHCAHNQPKPEIGAKESGSEGEILSHVGESGRPRGALSAHLHFSVLRVDPQTLPNGIDTIARSMQQLNDWWVDPSELFGGGSMPINDEIIGKSSQRDKVVNHYQYQIGTAKDDELLIKIQEEVQKAYERGKSEGSHPTVPPKEVQIHGETWVLNGADWKQGELTGNYKRKE